ncbi:MAG TPA: zf-TFIIB domain-containing protein [Thermoanaerobaculia bacterium]
MSTFEKPSTQEEEYFVREDAERLRKLHYEEQRRLAEHEKEALRRLHAGRCSQCGAQLVPERVGEIVVQHCPACGGAFLDRRAWEFLHSHAEPHSVMNAILNWFRSANKP